MLFNLYVRDSSQGIENSTSRSHRQTFLWDADTAALLFECVYLPCLFYVSLRVSLLSMCSSCLSVTTDPDPPAVPGLRHGGVPRADSAR